MREAGLVEFVKPLSSLASQGAGARMDIYEQVMDHGKLFASTTWAEEVALSRVAQNGDFGDVSETMRAAHSGARIKAWARVAVEISYLGAEEGERRRPQSGRAASRDE
jgi:hypothetical protein